MGAHCISGVKKIVMKIDKVDLKKEYGVLAHMLLSLDDNVVEHEDYLLIKDESINAKQGFDVFCKVIFKSWFMGFSKDKKNKIFKAIDIAVYDSDQNINKIFDQVEFVFDYEINDKRSFLKEMKAYLANLSSLEKHES